MAQRPWAGCVAGAALVVGCAAVVRAQSSAADAWSRVPALPTGCYTDAADADPFDKANAALTTEYDRQKKLNDQLKAQFDKMDQAEKMQRMQAFMMRDPRRPWR